MKVSDVLSRRVVSIEPQASVLEAVRLMLQNHISGLPVIDAKGRLVGMLTEGDLLRRAETGTQRQRKRWVEFLLGPGRMAEDYIHTHARRVEEVMTADPVTVGENAPLDEVVRLMEERAIKRLPVTHGGKVVGIVARADLLHALASVGKVAPASAATDGAIRDRILADIDQQKWLAPNIVNVTVRNGNVELWGTITDEKQRQALTVLVENVPGVKSIADHLAWVEPMSGLCIDAPERAAVPVGGVT